MFRKGDKIRKVLDLSSALGDRLSRCFRRKRQYSQQTSARDSFMHVDRRFVQQRKTKIGHNSRFKMSESNGMEGDPADETIDEPNTKNVVVDATAEEGENSLESLNAKSAVTSLTDFDCVSSQQSAAASLRQSNRVYIWGDWNGCILRPTNVDKLFGRSILFVVARKQTAWAVTEEGSVLQAGRNDRGQTAPSLAIANAEESATEYLSRFRRTEDLENASLKGVSTGEEHTLAVLDSGTVLAFGVNEFGQFGVGENKTSLKISAPTALPLRVAVIQVACGDYHSLVLARTGELFTCGDGSKGALGLGDLNGSYDFKPVDTLAGMPLVQIAAAGTHSVALSLCGRLYTWGKNRRGALALPQSFLESREWIVSFPQLVQNVPPIRKVATGTGHTVTIGAGGTLYVSGSNSAGQLGLPWDVTVAWTMSKKELHINVKPHSAECGDNHTVVLLNNGQVVSWGRNQEGQLGKDAPGGPEAVEPDVPKNVFFYSVSASENQTIAAAVVLRNGFSAEGAANAGTLVRQPCGDLVKTLRQEVGLSWHLNETGTNYAPPADRLSCCLSDGTDSIQSLPSIVGRALQVGVPRLVDESFHQQSSTVGQQQHHHHHHHMLLHRSSSPMGSFTQLEEGEYARQAVALARKMTLLPANVDEAAYTQELPAGMSVLEIRNLLRAARTDHLAKLAGQVVKRRFTEVFENPTRLNCSFLLPGRRAILDAEGLKVAWQELEDFEDANLRAALYRVLRFASASAVDRMLAAAAKYPITAESQLRFVFILLLSRFLPENNDAPAPSPILTKLFHFVFALPPSGRLALVQMARHYLADSAFATIVAAVRAYITKSIRYQHYPNPWRVHRGHPDAENVCALWYSIAFMQLLFLASTLCAYDKRRRSFDVLGRGQISGKLDLAEFHIPMDVLKEIGVPMQIEAFHGAALYKELWWKKWRASGAGKSVAARTHAIAPQSAGAEPGPSAATPETISPPSGRVAATESDGRDGRGGQEAEAQPLPEKAAASAPMFFAASSVLGRGGVELSSLALTENTTQLAALKIDDPTQVDENLEAVIEELNLLVSRVCNYPEHLMFGPADALIVNELAPWWCFLLAASNLLQLPFKRYVLLYETAASKFRMRTTSLAHNEIPFFILPVRRAHLVEDTFARLSRSTPLNFLKPLRVIFDGEEGLDAGGLTREFFSIITEKLFAPEYGMFETLSENRVVWFNRNSVDTSAEFWLVGAILGLAVYNDVVLRLSFPRVVYRKLQSQVLDLDDLAELFPAVAKSLCDTVQWPSSDIAGFEAAFDDFNFTVTYDHFGEMRTVELVPNGKEKKLTFSNRIEYAIAYAHYLLTNSVQDMFNAFREGFLTSQTRLLLTLSADELQTLVCGRPDFDFDKLRVGTVYEGYDPNDPYIEAFWQMLSEFDETQRQTFLRFCTGADNVPVEGLQTLQLKVQRNGGEPTDRLPTAYTCFKTLLLPQYSSPAKLKRLLLLALENAVGFGLQ